MTQGTISVLFGCHSIIHSWYVWRAWKIVHGHKPRFWQIVCIFLHDLGHWGLDYLDDAEQKKQHWKGGAAIARFLFGQKGYDLVAGHDPDNSGVEESLLYRPDKYSWHIASDWWSFWTTIAEPKLRMGYGRWEAVRRFKEQVAKNINSGQYRPTHELYLERCKGKSE